MECLIEFAKSVRSIFEREKENIGLPFFYSFPKNSCESAACFLALLVRKKFPDMQVEVIHGCNREEDGNHYWLEVDSLVYDITGDQFEEISEPVYGHSNHPMSTYFDSIKRFSVVNFVSHYIKNTADIELFCKNKKNIQGWLELNV